MTRAEMIDAAMRLFGVSRDEAEFIVAVELDEIPGDVIPQKDTA